MAVVIRLRRTGTRNRPSYRIVVAEKRKPRDGRFIETLGHYDPLRDPAVVKIDGERAVHWLQHGAVPSETVASLFKKQGISRDGVSQTVSAAAPVAEKPTPAAPAEPSPIG